MNQNNHNQCNNPPASTRAIRLKQTVLGLVLASAILAPHRTLAAAGPAPVNLLSTGHFTILAGAAITTTGGGMITGDVGASPIAGSAIGIPAAQVTGTIYEVDNSGPAGAVVDPTLLTAAKGDLTTAYNDAAGRTPIPSGPFLNPGDGNMGGLTLIPGLYKFTSTASISGSDLTLSGGPDDVWIFQVASDLEVANGIHVVLAGGAQARNIFWQVATSATIGTTAVFKGTILANEGITFNTSSSLEGRAMSFSAGVVFNGTGGTLPLPKAPVFTSISVTANAATVTVSTTPYFLLTLQSTTNLAHGPWTTIATSTPSTSLWSFTDNSSTLAVTNRFYRAFLPSN